VLKKGYDLLRETIREKVMQLIGCLIVNSRPVSVLVITPVPD